MYSPSETEFRALKDDCYSVCATVIKRSTEITEQEAKKQRYQKGQIEIKDQRTNKQVKMYVNYIIIHCFSFFLFETVTCGNVTAINTLPQLVLTKDILRS